VFLSNYVYQPNHLLKKAPAVMYDHTVVW